MKYPSLTVIITVLNEQKTLPLLLDALLVQTQPAKEIIVVDGGSHDKTTKVLKEYQRHFPQLKLRWFEKKGNRSVGRNFAINKAQHSLIAITDAGCIPDRNWLAELLKKYSESQAQVVAGYYNAKPQNAFEAAVVPYVLVMPDKVNEKSFLPATRSMLLEKKVWEVVGRFNERLSDNEDFAFAQQLVKQKVKIVFAKNAIVTWLPRTNLHDFYQMIFRFARGDAYAGIMRLKVGLLFLRYFGVLVVVFALFLYKQFYAVIALILILKLLYVGWSIAKNFRYARNGWFWLPVLQYVADWAVMRGSLVGLIKRVLRK